MAEPLTPQEIAQADALEAKQATPAADVFQTLSAQDLADLSTQTHGDFDPSKEFAKRKDLWGNPDIVQKAADAHNLLRQQGITTADVVQMAKNTPESLWGMAKGFAKQGYNYAAGLVGAPIAGMVGEVTGQGPEFQEALSNIAQRQVAENLAATEQATAGVGQMAERAVGKVFGKAPADETPEEKVKSLWDAVGRHEVTEEAGRGKGAMMSAVGGQVISDLEKAGLPIRPEETAQLAQGDPLSFWAFGRAFHGAGAVAKPVAGAVSDVAKAAVERAGFKAATMPASEVAAKVGGVAAEAAGKVQQAAGKAVQIGGGVAPWLGAAGGTLEFGPAGTVGGLAAGEIASRRLTSAGTKVLRGGEAVESFGRQVAGETPITSSAAQLGRDVLQAAPEVAKQAATGAALDVGTAMLTSETPEQRDNQPLFGTAFGLLSGARVMGRHVISGQIIGPRGYGMDKPAPVPNTWPALRAMHEAALAAAPVGVRQRVNAVGNFANEAAGVPTFMASTPEAMRQALVDSGLSPDTAAAWSQQKGVFTRSLPDAQGNPQRVILAIDPDAAPHESFHAVQSVLGEPANRAIDEIVKQAYGPQFDNEGIRYTARLLGLTPQEIVNRGIDWRRAILDASHWGDADAVEKVIQDVTNRLIAEQEVLPLAADVKAIVDGMVTTPEGQARHWQDIIPQDEQADFIKQISDRYVARELAAENFDVLFKHTGATLNTPPDLLNKLAVGIGNVLQQLGVNPVEGRVSQIGRLAPRVEVLKAVGEAAKGQMPKVEPRFAAPTAEVPTGRAAPAQKAAQRLDVHAETADPTVPPGETKSPQQVAQTLAEAARTGQGVLLKYASAPGQPGGALADFSTGRKRLDRRAEIEAARSVIPADLLQEMDKRATVEEVRNSSQGPLVRIWSQDVLAANLQMMAQWASRAIAKGADPAAVAKVVPYELDPTSGTFTPNGWRQAINDLRVFSENQQAGFTGAGEELVVPKNLPGIYKPEVTGMPTALPQERADMMNLVFGTQLPATPRVMKGKTPLNVAGQEVSAATHPGRVEVPVLKRGEVEREPFTPEAMEKAGLPPVEREIQEVNPARNDMIQLSKDVGTPPADLIDAWQWLRLNRIQDATLTPEVTPIRGNTLTLSAGFQPQGFEVEGERGGMKEKREFQAEDMAEARRLAENAGMRVSRVRPTTPTEAPLGMFQPGEAVTAPPEETPELDATRIAGGTVSKPAPSYHEAAQGEGNPWIRRSAEPTRSTEETNAGRTLLMQISSDLINAAAKKTAEPGMEESYYNKLYSGVRKGYARLRDFWEMPQWIGFASHFLPDADVYVVRNMDEAKNFLKTAGYGRVAFSSLDVNAKFIKELAQDYGGPVDVGGYTAPGMYDDVPNIKWHDSMKSLADDMGVPYSEGVDYRHFQGSDVIPRLTMSQGCKFKCAFCTVPKEVVAASPELVNQQADEIAKMGAKLVYLNDKTFGQASNYQMLADLNERIKAQNPDFKGFIIQTTASTMANEKVMPLDWLKKSGIRYVELGIESYNDPILHAMHKPATENQMNRAVARLREAGIALIPNILIGLPGETAETYARTLQFLKDNADITSHANIYNLALYKETELGKKITTASDADFDENVLEKSFHTDPEVHRVFAGDVYGLGSRLLSEQPEVVQYQPADVPNIRDMDELWGRIPGAEFQPGKTVDDALEVHNMDGDTFRTTTSTYKSDKYGGGLTGWALDVGSSVTAPEDLARLSEAMVANADAFQQAMKAHDFDAATLAANKKQFFREALEMATGGPSAEFVKKHFNPEYKAPLEGVQYQARTEAGQKLEDQGYEFVGYGHLGTRGVTVKHDGLAIGEISSFAGTDPKDAWVGNVTVNKPYRGKGIAEALYRELMTQLKEDGAQQVRGMVVSPEPVHIREKVFGPGNTRYFLNGEPVPMAAAWVAAQNYKFDAGKDENGNWNIQSIEPISTITPEAQFAREGEDRELRTVLPADYRNGAELAVDNRRRLDEIVQKHRETMMQAQPQAFSREDEFTRAAWPVIDNWARDLGWTLNRESAKMVPFSADRGLVLFTGNSVGGMQKVGVVSYQREDDGIAFHAANNDFKVVVPMRYGQPPGPSQSEVVGRALYENWKRDHPEMQAQPPAKKRPRGKGYAADEFWLGKGKLHPAPEGHEQWVIDTLGGEHSGGLEENYDIRQDNYDRAAEEGYKRVIVDVDTISVEPAKGFPTFASLPRSEKQELEDLAYHYNRSVTYNSREAIPKPNIPEAQAQPQSQEEWREEKAQEDRALLATQMREKEDHLRIGWEDVASDDFLPEHRPEADRGMAPILDIAAANNAGYASFDRGKAFSYHEYNEWIELRRGKAGQYPLTAAGLTKASKDYDKSANDAFAAAYGEPEGQAQPPGITMEEFERKKAARTGRPAAAPSKENEWTLKPAAQSKAWITPDGEPVQLGGQWHHAWLAEHADEYGLKVPPFEGEDVAGAREAALRKGFVRVNYDQNSGRLTIELRAQDFGWQRDAIEKLIEANLRKIDTLDVTTLNGRGTRPVGGAEERLFKAANREAAAEDTLDEVAGQQTGEAGPEPTKIRQARALPGEFQPGVEPPYLGTVDEESGAIEGVKGFGGHDAHGLTRGLRWRLDTNGRLVWWAAKEEVSEAAREAVKAWLEKRGQEVEWQSFFPEKQIGEFQPGVIGGTDDDLTTRGMEGKLELSRNTHEKVGLGRMEHKWRYDSGTKNVYWWEQPGDLSRDVKQAAEDWLEKRGHDVKGHRYLVRLGGYTNIEEAKQVHGNAKWYAKNLEFSAQPGAFESPEFDDEIAKIKAGKSDGQTFNPDGTVWAPKDKKVDLVTLASVNIPAKDLTRDNAVGALGSYQDLLDEPNVAVGMFKFKNDAGENMVSVDLNAVVPQKFRSNSIQFAHDNDQIAIWDVAQGKSIDTGGKGDTKLNKLPEIYDALDSLRTGKPADVAQIQKAHERGELAEEMNLPGMEIGRTYNKKAVEEMSRAELAEHFPEAIVPRRAGGKEPLLSSNITESPLYKEAGSREEAVKLFANRLVQFAKEWENHPVYQAGSRWYSEFSPMLNKHFGKWAPKFAELLAATSPQTGVSVNFGYAYDALRSLQEGRFDKITPKFNKGLDMIADGSWKKWWDKKLKEGAIENPPQNPSAATFLADWVDYHDLKPRQSNGNLYGQHSDPVLQVLVGKWMDMNAGPKVENFVQNLLGTGHRATIDLWADRTMRWAGYEGKVDRWRILPKNQAAVRDVDFAFAQDVFDEAAKKLGMKADALQGALWFAEKARWSDNGWGRLDLGDFQEEMKALPRREQEFQQNVAAEKRAAKKKGPKQEELGLVEPRE